MNTHPENHPGATVEGRYRLVRMLGEGTFGEVWRAEDLRLSARSVAMKFLKSEFLAHPEAVARFEAEADALAKVQHPHVVAVLDRGRARGTHFLVTEFVEGDPLTEWIASHQARRMLPTIPSALAIFEQICAGLGAAHAIRAPGAIVHRDIKPDNVLVRALPDGSPFVKVVDFGIAQLGQRTGTRTGAMMGTPLYMAPEQAVGNVAAIGPWTDVFSLAVVFIEMLTLRCEAQPNEPWWASAMQRGGSIRGHLGAMRTDVPPGVWDVLARALHADGVVRPADANALRAAVRGQIVDPSLALHSAMPPTAPGFSPSAHPAAGTPMTLVSALMADARPAGAPSVTGSGTVIASPHLSSTTAPIVASAPAPRTVTGGTAGGRTPLIVLAGLGLVVVGLVGATAVTLLGREERSAASTPGMETPSATPETPVAPVAPPSPVPVAPQPAPLAIVAPVPAPSAPPPQVAPAPSPVAMESESAPPSEPSEPAGPPPSEPEDPPAAPPSAARQRWQPVATDASSFISNGRRQHAPERAFDGDPMTAWNENDRGPGDGSWLSATFASTVPIARLTISTGYTAFHPRDGDLFIQNSRLRRVRVRFDDGTTVDRSVPDGQRELVIDGLSVRSRTVRIEALSVWPGTRWADLCISEVVVEG
jgi:serine/threonine protein kinase